MRNSETMGEGWVVTGAAGMLGREWGARIAREGVKGVRLLDRASCDVADAGSVARAMGEGTRVVINCAAWTDVDGAEAHEAEATRLNGDAVGVLAARCREVGATLVHYSTDYVFDGEARAAPYRVDEARRPINAYGRSKAAGEEALEGSGASFLMLRTSWLYAAHGKNFVRTIAKASRERESLRVVNDQRGRPTCCATLVDLTVRLLAAGARGTLHGCDDGEATWFDLAGAVAGWVNPRCRVEPCSSAEFPRPAKRPAYSVLDLGPTRALIGEIPDWRASLERTLVEMREQGEA
ncbi:MAG: dTDP-4-dehydrorhamnose reductase [Phycisphaerales bacterium]